ARARRPRRGHGGTPCPDGLRHRRPTHRAGGLSMLRRFDFWTLVMIGTWAILLLLLFIPVGSILLSSFYDRAGNPTLANYIAFAAEPRFQRAFVNTLIVGFGGLVGAVVLGSIMAFCISRFHIAGSRFVSLLAIL